MARIARIGSIQKKILLLLMGGMTLGLSRSPRSYFRILKNMNEEWKEIEQRALQRAIRSLYESKLISQKNNNDGTTTFVLSKKGKKVALSFNIDEIILKKHKWDKKWRIVMFDVPEKIKNVREAIRYHLRRLEFVELQRSVFVTPYQCQNEIEYITEFYNARRFIRFVEADYIDNEIDLKNRFHLK